MPKKRIYKRYRTKKRGGQRYWIGKQPRRRIFGSSMFRQTLPSKGIYIISDRPRDKKIVGEIFRKNPELIELGGKKPIGILLKGQEELLGSFDIDEGDLKEVYIDPRLTQTKKPLIQYKLIENIIPDVLTERYGNKRRAIAIQLNKSEIPTKQKDSGLAEVLAHELTHAKQSDRYGIKQLREMSKPVRQGAFPKDSENYKLQQKEFQEYLNSPMEREAKEAERRISEKRKLRSNRKNIFKSL
mgnify:FL=1